MTAIRTGVSSPSTPPAGGVSVGGRRRRVIPGFGLSLGYTMAWLGLIVLIPLVGLFVHSAQLGLDGLWRIWTEPRVLAALRDQFRHRAGGSGVQRGDGHAGGLGVRALPLSRAGACSTR